MASVGFLYGSSTFCNSRHSDFFVPKERDLLASNGL